jgi:hypothetical protein
MQINTKLLKPETVVQPKIIYIYYPKDENWNEKYYIASTELLNNTKSLIFIGHYKLQPKEPSHEPSVPMG